MSGNFGGSGLPRRAGREKLVFVCQEFSLPESIHWQKLSDFLSAFSKQTQEQKGKVEWHCHEPHFAVSEGCLGYLPGNYEIRILLLLKCSQSALLTEKLVSN